FRSGSSSGGSSGRRRSAMATVKLLRCRRSHSGSNVSVRSVIRPPSPRREHEWATLRAAARWGAADPEVIDAIAVRLRDGDGGAWVREWTAAGGEAWASAGSADTASMLDRKSTRLN